MRLIILSTTILCLIACEQQYREDVKYGDEDTVTTVIAAMETVPVDSMDDAADDPAIWYNTADPAQSLILGTDKKSGLGIYTLDGKLKQFIPAGLPNNVDIRQNIVVGNWSGDLAAASNRDGDVVTLFSITAEKSNIVGSFPSALPEPYGSCMGILDEKIIVFVTYKTGEVQAYHVQNISDAAVEFELLASIPLTTQLEGCAHDDSNGTLYIGEEARGLWRTQLSITGNKLDHTALTLVDEVDGDSGITADVEGVSLFLHNDKSYVVISSQGNDSYAVYDHDDNNTFRGRFRIANNPATGIDGAQETDGLEVDSRNFGQQYPNGIMIVQDGFNAPVGQAQNFKVVDWREVIKALNLNQ